jgi:hypothetical protein
LKTEMELAGQLKLLQGFWIDPKLQISF